MKYPTFTTSRHFRLVERERALFPSEVHEGEEMTIHRGYLYALLGGVGGVSWERWREKDGKAKKRRIMKLEVQNLFRN
jgi:hypothetical protein